MFIIITVISCTGHGPIHDYPDCISKPDNYIESGGCGNVFVYQFLDSTQALTVRIIPDSIDQTETCQTFHLGNGDIGIEVELEIAGDNPDSLYFNYCNDETQMNIGKTTVYKATAGQVTISILFDDKNIFDLDPKSFSYISIKIDDLHLVNTEYSTEKIIDEIVLWDVSVDGIFP